MDETLITVFLKIEKVISSNQKNNDDLKLTTKYLGKSCNNFELLSISRRDKMLFDRVYSMRYRSYSSKGYIDKNSSGKFLDEYDPMSSG